MNERESEQLTSEWCNIYIYNVHVCVFYIHTYVYKTHIREHKSVRIHTHTRARACVCMYICVSPLPYGGTDTTKKRRDTGFREEWKETRVWCAEAESNRGLRGLTRGYPCARTNRSTKTRRNPEDRSRTPERAAVSRNLENGESCYRIDRLMYRETSFFN